jgi:hypothetical protein
VYSDSKELTINPTHSLNVKAPTRASVYYDSSDTNVRTTMIEGDPLGGLEP